MTDSDDSTYLNPEYFTKYTQTQIPKSTEKYILYGLEDMAVRPSSDEFALVKHDRGSREILEMGKVEIKPASLNKTTVNNILQEIAEDTLSDEDWEFVERLYKEMTKEVIKDRLYDGTLQLYKNLTFTKLSDMGRAMRNRFKQSSFPDKFSEEYQYKIGNAIEQSLDWEADQVPTRTDTAFNTYKITKENISDIPFVEDCHLKAQLHFDEYPTWKVTAVEYYHRSVIQTPILAKTKALIDHGYSRGEISEILNISYKDVTRNCQRLENIYERIQWTKDHIKI